MTVRRFRPEDEAVLKEAYLRRGFDGGWRSMNDAISAFVVEEDGKPVALVAAHRIAEIRCVIDTEWQSPAWRWEALVAAHDAMQEDLKAKGFRRVTALLEGAIGRGFGKRMKRLKGWVISRGTAWEKEV